MMKVDIRSEEYVKPSSPTPNQFKTHKISLLDQFVPSLYSPTVLYYLIDDETALQTSNTETLIRLLKESLSGTLAIFYPYAGTIKDGLSIDCNDNGVYFVEARVDSCSLCEFLENPDNVCLIHLLLPSGPSSPGKLLGAGDHVATVQVTTFSCGGISIGILVAHVIADGYSRSYFLKNWAIWTAALQKTLRDDDVTFDFNMLGKVLPQHEPFPEELSMMRMLHPFIKKGTSSVTNRFVFDASALARLKAKVISTSVQNPTRVEVVIALIWKCAVAAFRQRNNGSENPCLISYSADLRRGLPPPYSDFKAGNLLCRTSAKYTPTKASAETELGHLVSEIKKSKSKIYYDVLKEAGGNEFIDVAKKLSRVFSSSAQEGADYLAFTCWNTFGLYDIDFGWGKPVWVTNSGSRKGSSVSLNNVYLLDTRFGDGIEAWVTLDEQTASVLESDQDLLEFASLNPSPLNLGTENKIVGFTDTEKVEMQ